MFQITLRAARESRGYTAEEVARCLGISISVYIAYERVPGTIPKIIACKIKKMYDISLEKIDLK